jgi:hypothetical protein
MRTNEIRDFNMKLGISKKMEEVIIGKNRTIEESHGQKNGQTNLICSKSMKHGHL